MFAKHWLQETANKTTHKKIPPNNFFFSFIVCEKKLLRGVFGQKILC